MTSETPGVSSVPDEKLQCARDYYEWFLAYQEVGFSEQQAIAILTRPAINMTPTQFPPRDVTSSGSARTHLLLTLQDKLKDE